LNPEIPWTVTVQKQLTTRKTIFTN